MEHFFKRSSSTEHEKYSYKISFGNTIFDQIVGWKFLNDSSLSNQFLIKRNTADKRVDSVMNGAVDICFLPSSAFPRIKGGWKVFADIATIIKKPLKIMNLFFKEGLFSFENVAVQKKDFFEIDLLKVILKEKYVIESNIDYNEKNKSKDALLLCGQSAFERSKKDRHFLDLSEEWLDLSRGKPLVTGFWVISEMCPQHEYIAKLLRQSLHDGISNLDQILKTVSFFSADNWQNSFDFNLDEEGLNSLDELFRLLFYHGITEYVPELFFV